MVTIPPFHLSVSVIFYFSAPPLNPELSPCTCHLRLGRGHFLDGSLVRILPAGELGVVKKHRPRKHSCVSCVGGQPTGNVGLGKNGGLFRPVVGDRSAMFALCCVAMEVVVGWG